MVGKLIPYGYANDFKMEYLLSLMEDSNVRLFDIRYNPWTKAVQWRRDESTGLAVLFGERYQHLRSLGNKNYQRGPILLNDPDYGIPCVVSCLKAGYDVILLCGCKSYNDCHRKAVVHLVCQQLPNVQVIQPDYGKVLDGGMFR